MNSKNKMFGILVINNSELVFLCQKKCCPKIINKRMPVFKSMI